MAGNVQREHFKSQVAEHMKHMGGADGHHPGAQQGDGKTHIEHHEEGRHPDGAPEGTMHTVHHHDGEVSHHPTMGHAAMHMAAKHDGGEHGHIHIHPAGATTHHVGMDGEVQGPHEHDSEDEAYGHLQGNIGEGGGMEPDPDARFEGAEAGESSFE